MKKLLVLGGNYVEQDIVIHAQQLGYYVIVTDNHTNIEDSPAKQIANEGWNISWADIDSLEKECRKSSVDGVFAGFSEFRVDCMIQLCERLGLPCYITKEQLEITRDKVAFKTELKKYNVPVVPEFKSDDDILFPVIVKPTDRAGSIGIRVANNISELADAIHEARQKSPTGSYIIEKYMTGSIKIDAYYVIIDDIIYFVGSNDTLMCPPQKGHEVMQSAWLYPSRFEHIYLDKVDDKFRSFLKGIGIRNGYITLSAFIDKNEDVYVFETGFRMSGELSYYYTEEVYAINYLDYLIEFSLGNPIDKYRISGNKISENKCLSINFFANDCKVSKISLPQIEKGDVFKNYTVENEIIRNNDSIVLKKVAMSIVFGNTNTILSKSKQICDNYMLICDSQMSQIYYKPDTKILEEFTTGQNL